MLKENVKTTKTRFLLDRSLSYLVLLYTFILSLTFILVHKANTYRKCIPLASLFLLASPK